MDYLRTEGKSICTNENGLGGESEKTHAKKNQNFVFILSSIQELCISYSSKSSKKYTWKIKNYACWSTPFDICIVRFTLCWQRCFTIENWRQISCIKDVLEKYIMGGKELVCNFSFELLAAASTSAALTVNGFATVCIKVINLQFQKMIIFLFYCLIMSFVRPDVMFAVRHLTV